MAEQRRNSRRYRTYGSVAYQPEVEEQQSRRGEIQGNTVRRPEPVRRPSIQPRRRPVTRPDVQVRTQTAVAPFAIVGLFAVLVCTFLLVVSTARLAQANNEIVDMRGELADLQDEARVLQAKYEQVFDLEAIEKQLLSSGSMVRARPGQTVYLDLSAPDSVVYYDGAGEGLSALLNRAEQYLGSLMS